MDPQLLRKGNAAFIVTLTNADGSFIPTDFIEKYMPDLEILELAPSDIISQV